MEVPYISDIVSKVLKQEEKQEPIESIDVEMNEPASKKIIPFLFSVDPGFTNVGNVTSAYEYNHEEHKITWYIFKDLISTDTVYVSKQIDTVDYANAVKRWLHHKLDRFRNDFPIIALVEKQYTPIGEQKGYEWISHQLSKAEVILVTTLQNRFDLYTLEMHPNNYKRKLGIATKSHSNNKKAVEEYVHDLFKRCSNLPEFKVNHHVADCLAQAAAFLLSQYQRKPAPNSTPTHPTLQIEFVDSSIVRKWLNYAE